MTKLELQSLLESREESLVAKPNIQYTYRTTCTSKQSPQLMRGVSVHSTITMVKNTCSACKGWPTARTWRPTRTSCSQHCSTYSRYSCSCCITSFPGSENPQRTLVFLLFVFLFFSHSGEPGNEATCYVP